MEMEEIIAHNAKVRDITERLADAVRANDFKKVKSIFEENRSIKGRDGDLYSLIRDVIGSVNNGEGTNLLACTANNKMAEYLIAQGVKFTSAIQHAIPDLEAIKSICEVNKSIVKRELQKDSSISTALAYRTFDNDVNDTIKYLAKQGVNFNAVDSGGRYLLHFQIARGNLKGAKAFIENGADVNTINQEENGYWRSGIDAGAQKGQTALFFAI